MRLIDADKLFPDVMTKREALAISQGQLAYAPTVEAIPKDQYEARLKADMVTMLNELKYELYQALCHEIHGKEDCPCTNQTTSCLATFRVCDANSAIYKVIQQKINSLKEKEDA